jgi:acid phosphatase family membrane protein YuiD
MIRQLLYRQIFLVPIICGFFIQCLKVLVYSIVERRTNIGRFVQVDGMPNIHSAVFSSLSTGIGIKYGVSSILFSLITTYSVIIIHDTMRLKGEKGKQVGVLNKIISSLEGYGEIGAGQGLRVLHFRPLDVASGTILGILGAYVLL